MKLTVDPAALSGAAAWAAQALPSRPAVPVLAGIRLEASGGTVTLAAFDYDVAATATVKADVETEGTVILPGRLLTEIARSLPAKDAILTTGDARADLWCGAAKFSLLTLPMEDYPALPQMPPAAGTVGAEFFAHAAAQVTAAAGRDGTLPVLTGVLLEPGEGTLTLVATDRYRLAVRHLPWEAAALDLEPVVIPARSLAAAAKAMTGGDVVTVAIGGDLAAGHGMAGFSGAGKTLVTRLIGGDFPKYSALLPKATLLTAVVGTAMLAEAVRRAALVAERNTAVRLTFSEGELKIAAGTGEEAQAEEILPARWSGEEEFPIAFNPAYLLDGLTAAGEGFVQFAFTEPGRPAVLTRVAEDGQEAGYIYLLMPIRLGT